MYEAADDNYYEEEGSPEDGYQAEASDESPPVNGHSSEYVSPRIAEQNMKNSNAGFTPYRASVIPPTHRHPGHLVPISGTESIANRAATNPKHVLFYGDANVFRPALKLVISRRFFKTIDVLQTELSRKMPELPRGCRAIFTPRGRDRVMDVDELEDNGNYLCSSFKTRAKGLDITKVAPPPAFHVGRAKSGRRLYSLMLQNPSSAGMHGSNDNQPDWDDSAAVANDLATSKITMEDRKTARARQFYHRSPGGKTQMTQAESPSLALSPGRTTRKEYKKVFFRKSGEPYRKHLVVLSRKSPLTFEKLLTDLSDVFQIRVRRVFTLDGRPIESISAIFNGPNTYICSLSDSFQARDAWVDNAERAAKESRKKYTSMKTGRQEGAVAEASRPFGTSRGNWLVYVRTGKELPASTSSSLHLTIYGTRAVTEPIPLSSLTMARDDKSPERVLTGRAVELFKPGTTDVFEINIGNIGRIYKVRLNSTYAGDQPDYFCDEIRMHDKNSGETLVFPLRRWLARNEEDGEICREMPAVRPGETPFNLVKYRVEVTTGDYWNAGTQADIFITVYGEHGDTGVRRLWKSTAGEDSQDKLFQKGRTDTFELEAVNLGRLRTTVIGHDVHANGQGWFLERVIVIDLSTGREFLFPCSKWLDEGEADGKIVREIECIPPQIAVGFGRNLFDCEKWKYESGNELILFSKMSGRALEMHDDSNLDALGDEHDLSSVFEVASRRNNLCVFKSSRFSSRCIAIENGKVIGKGLGGPGSHGDFVVHVQQDRCAMMENVKNEGQYITVQANGQLADARWSISGPSRLFVVYCRGMLRDNGVVVFATSAIQTLSVNFERRLTGLGKRNKLAQFMVHKVHEVDQNGEKIGRLRMFASAVLPGRFLRLTPTEIDCEGDGSTPDSQFIVHVHKNAGYVRLESYANRGMFIGLELDGSVVPVATGEDVNVRLYPEVIKFGRSNRTRAKVTGFSVPPTQRPHQIQYQPAFLTDSGAAAFAGASKSSPREPPVATRRGLPPSKNAVIQERPETEVVRHQQKNVKQSAPASNTQQETVHSPKPPSIPKSPKSNQSGKSRTRTTSPRDQTDARGEEQERSRTKSLDGRDEENAEGQADEEPTSRNESAADGDDQQQEQEDGAEDPPRDEPTRQGTTTLRRNEDDENENGAEQGDDAADTHRISPDRNGDENTQRQEDEADAQEQNAERDNQDISRSETTSAMNDEQRRNGAKRRSTATETEGMPSKAESAAAAADDHDQQDQADDQEQGQGQGQEQDQEQQQHEESDEQQRQQEDDTERGERAEAEDTERQEAAEGEPSEENQHGEAAEGDEQGETQRDEDHEDNRSEGRGEEQGDQGEPHPDE